MKSLIIMVPSGVFPTKIVDTTIPNLRSAAMQLHFICQVPAALHTKPAPSQACVRWGWLLVSLICSIKPHWMAPLKPRLLFETIMNFNVNNEKYVYILYGSFFSRLHSASHKSDFITYQGTIPLPTRLPVDKTQQTTIAWSCALYDVEHKSAQFCTCKIVVFKQTVFARWKDSGNKLHNNARNILWLALIVGLTTKIAQFTPECTP